MGQGADVRVIVCGGRNYSDGSTVARVLSSLDPRSLTVVHGGAPGADSLADDWCRTFGVAVDPHPADWKRYGRAAGPIRNREMVNAGADLVIAFPGGDGTADCVRAAYDADLTVLEVNP